MNPKDIAPLRLSHQQIQKPPLKNPQDLVQWMGAMQAQDFAMAQWAVGLRVKGSTQSSVLEALNRGEILRTHLLRPTWHLVAAQDIYWMLELSAPQIKATARSRFRQLEIDEALVKKSQDRMAKALAQAGHLTREALVKELEGVGVANTDNRPAHLLILAELDGLICSGPTEGSKTTYALLEERVPHPRKLARDEALAELAQRYFQSHSPATVQDFAWWSGLSAKEARQAAESLRTNFISEQIDGEIYWFSRSANADESQKGSVHLLPAFDEFLISYKNRSASLAQQNYKRAASSNGIFWPILVIDGEVKGLWKRSIKKDRVSLEVSPFEPLPDSAKKAIEEKGKAFADFLGKKMSLANL